MYCKKCGKAVGSEARFCQNCGEAKESPTSLGLSRHGKGPLGYVLGAAFIFLLLWGGSSAYAYIRAGSKISEAESLQADGHFASSTQIAESLSAEGLTDNQKMTVESLVASNKKFIEFQEFFEKAIEEKSASTTAGFQAAQKLLEQITEDYPKFDAVAEEKEKLKDLLVVALGDDAEKAKVEARQSREWAQEEKQRVQAEASAAATVAESQRLGEVLLSYGNQLKTIERNFYDSCMEPTSEYISYLQAGDYAGVLTYGSAAITGCNTAMASAQSLKESYTNMPPEYVQAADDMYAAAYYMDSALGNILDDDLDDASEDVSNASSYLDRLLGFTSQF